MASVPLVKRGKFPEKRDYSEQSISLKGFIRITESENMTQSGGMEAVSDFGCRRRLYFTAKMLCLEN